MNHQHDWTAGERRKFARSMRENAGTIMVAFVGFSFLRTIAPVLLLFGIVGLAYAGYTQTDSEFGFATVGLGTMLARARDLKDQRAAKAQRMSVLVAKPKMTEEDKREFDRLERECAKLQVEILELERQAYEGAEVIDNPPRIESMPDGGLSEWRDTRTGAAVRVLAPTEKLSSPARPEVGFGSFVRALVLGAKTDAERRALEEGTPSAGGYTVPQPLAANLIDKLRAEAVCIRAGARTVPMTSQTLTMARVATEPVASWRSEGGAIAESDATFESVLFTARALGCLVKVSRELLEDSANVDQLIPGVFSRAMALELDRVCLVGSGTPPEPQGIAGAGIAEVPLGGAALTDYDPIIDAIQELRNANAGEPTAAIMNPRSLTAFDKLKDNTLQPLRRPPSIEKLPFLTTTQVPTNDPTGSPVVNQGSRIFVGNFADMMIGIRTQLLVEVLRERYMPDTGQLGFIAWFRGDVQLAHAESFAQVTGVL